MHDLILQIDPPLLPKLRNSTAQILKTITEAGGHSMYYNGIQVMTYFCLDSPSFACHVYTSFCADIYKACDECEAVAPFIVSHEGCWVEHNVSLSSVCTDHRAS